MQARRKVLHIKEKQWEEVMAGKKYYAVRKGVNPGIYNTWDECSSQVTGVAGAEFKGFLSLEDAQKFMNGVPGKISKTSRPVPKKKAVKAEVPTGYLEAYVDGSYNGSSKCYGYGVAIVQDGKSVQEFVGGGVDSEGMRNVTGEIHGALKAMQYALEEKKKGIIVYYDYKGVREWALGDWKANKDGTKAYAATCKDMMKKIDVRFVKVKAHSGDEFNDLADRLAKIGARVE